MAYADPQSVTINGVATPLPRTGLSLNEGAFDSANRETRLVVKHDASKARDRHVAKLSVTKIAADPLIPAQNVQSSYSVHIVVDAPKTGVPAADAVELAKALIAWATAANLTKLVGGES